jgi:uncharacterized LabA/DUF88 family protein
VDRCALFVDAGYMLADGATAVHGTSSRDSVSWDYAGLLRFLASLFAERTGQQLLRCYWYEASVDGRRTPEHDTLADLPGLTLRLGRMRPGQPEGVEAEIHRDLTTLATNRAISDVLLVSAEEDLAQVIADVQDLGIRVMIVHISVDGNWTVSRSLRQQCDDVIRVDGTQLRPYVELIVGAEPARYDEPYAVDVYGGKPLANGHALSAGGSGHPGLPSGFAESPPAPSAIYTAPVAAEHQPAVRPPAGPPAALPPPPTAPAAGAGPESNGRGMHRSHAPGDSPLPPAPQPLPGPQPIPGPQPAPGPHPGAQASPAPSAPPGPPAALPAQDRPAAQHGAPASAPGQAHPGPAPDPLPPPRSPGQAAAGPSAAAPSPAPGRRAAGPRPPYAPSDPDSSTDPAVGRVAFAPPEQFTSTPPNLPARRGGPAAGLHRDGRHGDGRHRNGLPFPQGPQPRRPQPDPRDHQAARSAAASPDYVPQQGSYDAQLLAPSTAGRAPAGGSLAGTVQTAHSEGFEFGESVARDAPALWLEAVLARKPRMPSDLEARLLQGSALPIDALLHDEVRHALRRGFWDALERSRR